MAIKYRKQGTGGQRITMTRCPACGHEIGAYDHAASHIAKHDPDDFGLSPLEEK